MTATLEYCPIGDTPFPDNARSVEIQSEDDLRFWLNKVICDDCLRGHDIRSWTLSDWILTGCGCEFYLDDPDNTINLGALMEPGEPLLEW